MQTVMGRMPAPRAIGAALYSLVLASCGGGGGGGESVTPIDDPSAWIIPAGEVVDGGPGKDGIPALDRPVFQRTADNSDVLNSSLVVGILHEGEYRAFPHEIMDYHEVANDSLQFNAYVLSYCPLTGSAMAWDVDDGDSNTEFGVSGLLYNSNLILYDRLTDSRWSQMLQQAVEGSRSEEMASRLQVVETTWATWKTMYPDSWVLSRDTGHAREYDIYPYGGYRSSNDLLFPVDRLDNRLHPKLRVIGIHSGSSSRVYQISGFGATTQTINDQFENQTIVVVGNTNRNFAAIYSRQLTDGTILTFSPLDDQSPNVMQDDEGNVWNVFGAAVAGPRTGEQLAMTRSFTAMWFAWATFFEGAEIYF
jgi:hypothetical protein